MATGLPADAASLVGDLFSELVQLGANEAWDSLPGSITGWMSEHGYGQSNWESGLQAWKDAGNLWVSEDPDDP